MIAVGLCLWRAPPEAAALVSEPKRVRDRDGIVEDVSVQVLDWRWHRTGNRTPGSRVGLDLHAERVSDEIIRPVRRSVRRVVRVLPRGHLSPSPCGGLRRSGSYVVAQ